LERDGDSVLAMLEPFWSSAREGFAAYSV